MGGVAVNCMKCGREVEQEGAVFCSECLKVMARYPVRPGTAVHLPKRSSYMPVRRASPKRWTVPPEERIKRQQKLIRRLLLALAIFAVINMLLTGLLIYSALEDETTLIGQNYTVIQELLPQAEEE